MDEQTENKWCIVSDESGHNYLIQDSDTAKFREWVDYTKNGGFRYDGFDYDCVRLNGPAEFYLPADMRLVMNRGTGEFGFIPGSSAIVKLLETV